MKELKEKLYDSPVGRAWKRIGATTHHGIDLILSCLHSKQSCGIGEFNDLMPVIDWCSELKLDIIQLLPLNDSGDDPSPYFSLSSCALNPIFLSLYDLPYLDKHPALKRKLDPMREFNKLPKVPYHDVLNHKMTWLRDYFECEGEHLANSQAFSTFEEENKWLEPYALFKALKKFLSQTAWTSWPEDLKKPTLKHYKELLKSHGTEVTFYKFLQYLCYVQLQKVKQYAASKKIFIKGDIPILISPDSTDVWHHSELFDLSLSAGAPPDMYNPEGQYWGFPLFNWEMMKHKHYQWWKQRLSYNADFYDLYRIDHVLGFFRIWAIPLNHESKEGAFIPEDAALWKQHGKEILEHLVSFCSMLPIAEDLGARIPAVTETLLEMGICGTKIMRWERLWETDQSFIPIEHYPPVSLSSVSTHDSPTLTLWWRDFPEEAKAYAAYKHWDYDPKLSKEKRRAMLWDSHHSASMFHINLIQEYLALFPELVWPDPEDERINIPGKVLPTNWTYRMRPSLEELTCHTPLKEEMHQLLFSPNPFWD